VVIPFWQSSDRGCCEASRRIGERDFDDAADEMVLIVDDAGVSGPLDACHPFVGGDGEPIVRVFGADVRQIIVFLAAG